MQHFGNRVAARGDQPFTTGTSAAPRLSGDIGFAETYIAGDWTTPPSPTCCALHRQPPGGGRRDLRHLGRAAAVPHRAPAQPQHQGQQPQEHPRPLRPGQAFYELWLDETMNLLVGLVRGDLRRPMVMAQHAKVPRAAQAVCSRATACWRSAAAGARWPKWPPPVRPGSPA